MARGLPDWAEYAPQEVFSKVLDMAELAVRLGSPCMYDRGGTVIFYDDFNNGDSKWQKNIGGTQRIEPSSKNVLYGQYSLAFYDDRSAPFSPTIQVSIPFVVQTPVGLEGGFSLTSVDSNAGLNLTIIHEGYESVFEMHYYKNSKEVLIKNSSGGYTTVASDVNVPAAEHAWFAMKLVVDPLTGQYVLARFNNRIINLTNISAYRNSTTKPEQITLGAGIATTGSEPVTNYLDYIIVTQNEERRF